VVVLVYPDVTFMATATQQKMLGAFYTADPIARFLVQWAVRSAEDTVLDPSCGEGVFLQASAGHMYDLGNSRPRILGVDIDPAALRSAHLRAPESRLLEGDFFRSGRGTFREYRQLLGILRSSGTKLLTANSARTH
jgi:hypothetical protein